MGGLHGRKRGWPSSRKPVNRLQIGFVPKSGRLLPTRTTIVAGLLAPEQKKNSMPLESEGSEKLMQQFSLFSSL